MLVEACNIEWLTGEELDEMLALGWFRGRGIMFKAGIICFDNGLQSTLNIRLVVPSFEPKKSHRKLLRRNAEKYRVQWNPLKLDAAKNELYRQHAKRFKEFSYDSIEEALLYDGPERMFEEWECAVYLDNRLVAISFVDIGRNSMASIMCCFAKDQEKSSLGIYTMLLEMEFAKNRGLTYYYPGYVMDFSDAFAYKLSLGAAEWLNSKGQWTLNREEVLDHTYMKLLNQKMNALHEMLALHGIDATLKYYPFFAMGYLPTPEKLLELPSFFSWRQGERNFGAGYHVDEGRYLFFELSYAQELQDLQPPKFTEEFLNNPIYELDYIKTDIRVYFDTFSALYALIEEVLANKSVDRLTKR